MINDFIHERKNYSLDFLKNQENSFKDNMLKYIVSNFSDMLGEEDYILLENADHHSLELLAARCKKKLQQSRTI